jgi:hypothetical protein
MSAGLNLLLSQVKSKYFLVVEDDFEFTENTNLDGMLELMLRHRADIIGGKVLAADDDGSPYDPPFQYSGLLTTQYQHGIYSLILSKGQWVSEQWSGVVVVVCLLGVDLDLALALDLLHVRVCRVRVGTLLLLSTLIMILWCRIVRVPCASSEHTTLPMPDGPNCPFVHFVPPFFMAKTSSIRDKDINGWDLKLKAAGYIDFWLRLKTYGRRVAVCEQFEVVERFDPDSEPLHYGWCTVLLAFVLGVLLLFVAVSMLFGWCLPSLVVVGMLLRGDGGGVRNITFCVSRSPSSIPPVARAATIRSRSMRQSPYVRQWMHKHELER